MSTEHQINEDHAARWAEAAEQYGGIHNVPNEVRHSLSERLRQAWVNFVERRDRGDADEPHRRNKTKLMMDYCRDNVGAKITAPELAEAVGASNGTAYGFISEHRYLFRGEGRGVYVIIDPAAERAAERASVPAAPPVVAAPVAPVADVATQAAIDIASAAIGQMAGEERPRTVGKL